LNRIAIEKEEAMNASPIKKILCAIDFSEFSPAVAAYGRLFAHALGAEILAVYVAPGMERYVDMGVPEGTMEEFAASVHRNAVEAMNEFVGKHFADVKVTARVVAGYPPETLVAEAEDNGCGLIVMGTHGRGGVGRMFFGSVAEKVVKTAPMPVTTIRASES
jgi:nucleotide-binding universal stress UspA family protein